MGRKDGREPRRVDEGKDGRNKNANVKWERTYTKGEKPRGSKEYNAARNKDIKKGGNARLIIKLRNERRKTEKKMYERKKSRMKMPQTKAEIEQRKKE